MKSSQSVIIAKGLIFASLGIVLELFSDTNIIDEKDRFILITILLLIYLAGEVFRVKSVHPDRWVINPAVLCSLFTFFIAFGISNLIYFLPKEMLDTIGYNSNITQSMNKLMVLVLLGAIAMWLSYWSPIAGSMGAQVRNWLHTSTLIKRSFVPRRGALITCLLISLAGRMYQIRSGIFGYSSNLELLSQAASYTQYLYLANGLGTVALIIAAMQHYSGQMNPVRSRTWLVLILLYEIFFGFLSGFKSQVIMPLLVVAISQYWCLKKIPWKIFIFIPLAIFFAYAIIEPFRYVRYNDVNFDNKSFGAIAETVYDAAFSERSSSAASTSRILSFAGRMNMTHISSLGITFADRGPLPGGSPEFLEDILLSPLHAYVPRLIWSTKSVSDHGSWYTRTVMGHRDNMTSSTAMSPFTYLYFAGGSIAVVAGFCFLGLLHRIFSEFLTEKAFGGEAIVLLLFLPTIVFVGSVFSTLFVNLFRMLPLFILFQYLLFSNRGKYSLRTDNTPLYTNFYR